MAAFTGNSYVFAGKLKGGMVRSRGLPILGAMAVLAARSGMSRGDFAKVAGLAA
jgi:hypothetical protein